MDKPLKGWTIGELLEHCKHHENCVNCDVQAKIGCCFFDCDPLDLDLSEKPRFTQQEVEDAKKIKYLLPNAIGIGRQAGIIMLYVNRLDGSFTELKQDLFPSIQPGQEYTLDEIIGGEE